MANRFEHVCENELEIEVDVLQNDRRRVTRRFKLKKDGNAADAVFSAFGDDDPAEITSGYTGYDNLKLLAQKIVPPSREHQFSILVMVFETFTGEWVAEVDDEDDYDLNGLKRTTRVLVAEAGTSFADFVVGTQLIDVGETQRLASLKVERNDTYTRLRAVYLEPGLVSRSVSEAEEGLRDVTTYSFYVANAESPGIITSQTQENVGGYPLWRTTVKQKLDGTSPISEGVASSYGTKAPFEYPGRAKLFTVARTFAGGTVFFFDCFLSPKVTALIDATVQVSYQTSAAIGSLPHTFWNPTEWATLRATWVNRNDDAQSKVEGLTGYRTSTGAAQSIIGTGAHPPAFGWTIFGTQGFNSSLGTATGPLIYLDGGPSNPEGNTYVISKPDIQPVFSGVDGTQYYRKVVVFATIPAQPALPV